MRVIESGWRSRFSIGALCAILSVASLTGCEEWHGSLEDLFHGGRWGHGHHHDHSPKDAGSDAGDAEPAITVESPGQGEVIANPQVTISGRIENYSAGQTLHLNGLPVPLSADGSFSVPDQQLLAGENVFSLVLADASLSIVAQTSVQVFHLPAGVTATRIDAAGGSVEVTDAASPLFGARLSVPAGAVNQEIYTLISSDDEHFPLLPFGLEAVGPPVRFSPVGTRFEAPATVAVPFDPARLPPGTSTADVQLLALGDDGWVPLSPVVAGERTVSAEVDAIFFDPFVAAVQRPVGPGQARIDSTPPQATVYVDGSFTGQRTPVTLEGIAPGNHEIKLHLPGFNEVFETFVQPSSAGTAQSFALSTPSGVTPTILLDQDLSSIADVTSAELTLTGAVLLEGAPLPNQRVVFSLNGRDTIDRTDASGRFDSAVVLRRGLNRLQLRTTAGGQTYASPIAAIRLGSPDITVALNWNTNDTDIDMHLFDPRGAHAWYGSLRGIPNGALDRDDVDGFGPEIFSLSDPAPGVYRVTVDAYQIKGTATTATLEVRLGNTLLFAESHLFTGEDFNSGGGLSGSAAAFWDAFTFEVGPVRIARVAPPADSTPEEAVFTTQAGERSILVELEAPASIEDTDLGIAVEETNESFALSTDALAGRSIRFDAAHRQPTAAQFRSVGYPLQYRVVAFQKSDREETETDPSEVLQEARSRLRQEYVDALGGGRPGFSLPAPARESVMTASDFPGSNYFNFAGFVQDSDIPGMGVIGESIAMADNIRSAFGHPLRLTSAYRNPRSNARLANSAANSRHQTGNAVDLNPLFNVASYPATILCDPANPASAMSLATYAQAQQALVCVANRLYPAPVYDAFFHINHVHVERN